jgi:ParB/RepB/Spo0J family partition protein
LLVRPITEHGFEIVAGARRYRAAQMAEAATVPVRIVHLSDAETLEAQLVENLMRRDVHPMEEAQGFRALLNLEEPKYSIEQIAGCTGKNPAYIASRLKLTELAPVVVEAFYREEIGVGHALLLAKLQPAEQEQALVACFIARQYGIKKAKDNDSIAKLFAAYVRRAEESVLGSLLVEITILYAVMRQNARQALLDAATAYKVDTPSPSR